MMGRLSVVPRLPGAWYSTRGMIFPIGPGCANGLIARIPPVRLRLYPAHGSHPIEESLRLLAADPLVLGGAVGRGEVCEGLGLGKCWHGCISRGAEAGASAVPSLLRLLRVGSEPAPDPCSRVAVPCGVRSRIMPTNDRCPISPELVDALIALGRTGVPGLVPGIHDDRSAHDALVSHGNRWSEVFAGRNAEDIRDALVGVVLVSRSLGQAIGGSVSPVVWMFWLLVARNPPWLNELSAWIVRNSMNEHEPFGSCRSHSFPDFEQFKAWETARALRSERNLAREAAREEEARLLRRPANTRNLVNAVRRGDILAVKALLADGADPREAMPGGGSLRELARANGRELLLQFLENQGID